MKINYFKTLIMLKSSYGKRTFLLLLIILPTFLFAQATLWGNDTTSKRIMKNDCDDKIFTRVESLASLRTSNETFEDTLTSFLKLKKAFPKMGKSYLNLLLQPILKFLI